MSKKCMILPCFTAPCFARAPWLKWRARSLRHTQTVLQIMRACLLTPCLYFAQVSPGAARARADDCHRLGTHACCRRARDHSK